MAQLIQLIDPDKNDMSANARKGRFERFGEALDLHRLISIVRRRLPLATAVAAAVFAVTALYVVNQPTRYTATANVLLDQRKTDIVQVNEVVSKLPEDTNVVDTEVQVIRSRALADRVVTKLHLDQDPDFNPHLSAPGMLGRARAMLSGSFAKPGGAGPVDARLQVVENVLSGLRVSRSGLTYMIDVSYEASTPAKAALLANTFAELYISEQLDAKYDATRQANTWLGSRLNELRGQVQTAEAAVEQYRISNNLMSSQGATLTEQQISRLDEQLALARAAQAEQQARLTTAQSQLARGSAGDDVGEALGSQVIQNLRQQRAEVAGKVAQMEEVYGPRYPPLLQARSQVAEFDKQINDEIRRIMSNLEAQAQVAHERTQSIASSADSSRGSLAGNNRAAVRLRELERNAEAVRTLYETFLARYRETSAQVGLADSDARIVSKAKPPAGPTSPNIPMGLLLGFLFAGAAGLGVMTISEALDTSLSTGAQLEEKIGVTYLGPVPLLSSTDEARRFSGPPEAFVIAKPFSGFAEALRNLLTVVTAGQQSDPIKVLAVTSSLPGEGKSTTSIGLARLAALAGQKTILVDCDLRHRSVSRALMPDAEHGLSQVLNGSMLLEQALYRDLPSGADILAIAGSGSPSGKGIFGSDAMGILISQLRAKYDIVILDTPPVLPIADTLAIAPKVDTVLYLARWRKTPLKALDAGVRLLEQVGANIAGVALTSVNMRQQSSQGYGDASYYYKSYRKYYLEN